MQLFSSLSFVLVFPRVSFTNAAMVREKKKNATTPTYDLYSIQSTVITMPTNANQKHAWKPDHSAAVHRLLKSGDITREMIYGEEWKTRASLDTLGQREEFSDVFHTYIDKHGEEAGRKQFQRRLQDGYKKHYKQLEVVVDKFWKPYHTKAVHDLTLSGEINDDIMEIEELGEREVFNGVYTKLITDRGPVLGLKLFRERVLTHYEVAKLEMGQPTEEDLLNANEEHEQNQQDLDVEMEFQRKMEETNRQTRETLEEVTGIMKADQKVDEDLLKEMEKISKRVDERHSLAADILKKAGTMRNEETATAHFVRNAKKKAIRSGKRLEQAKSDYNSDFEPVDSKENSGGLINSINSIFGMKKPNPADEVLKLKSKSKSKSKPKKKEVHRLAVLQEEEEGIEAVMKDDDTTLKEDNEQRLDNLEFQLQMNKMQAAPMNTPKPKKKKAPSTPSTPSQSTPNRPYVNLDTPPSSRTRSRMTTPVRYG